MALRGKTLRHRLIISHMLIFAKMYEAMALYEGHPIKNETFFIIRKPVCVFS